MIITAKILGMCSYELMEHSLMAPFMVTGTNHHEFSDKHGFAPSGKLQSLIHQVQPPQRNNKKAPIMHSMGHMLKKR